MQLFEHISFTFRHIYTFFSGFGCDYDHFSFTSHLVTSYRFPEIITSSHTIHHKNHCYA